MSPCLRGTDHRSGRSRGSRGLAAGEPSRPGRFVWFQLSKSAFRRWRLPRQIIVRMGRAMAAPMGPPKSPGEFDLLAPGEPGGATNRGQLELAAAR